MQTVLPSDSHLQQKLFHKETQIVSQDQKYPQLFKWKTATLILGAITAILLLVLLVVIYNIQSQPQIVTNLTFLSSIITNSHILTNKQQILHFSNNFQSIYGTTKFQQATLLHRGTNFTTNTIKQDIYGKQNQKIIYLISLQLNYKQTAYPIRFATFMNSPFPMPKDQDFDNKLAYYSFQIKDQRKSSLLSLTSDDSLKLYSTNSEVKSVSECQNYRFEPTNQDRNGSFMLLNNLIWFDFGSNQTKISTQGYKCFSPSLQNEQQLQTKLQTILHPLYNQPQSTLELKLFQSYYLAQ